jgi:hypothetical protein
MIRKPLLLLPVLTCLAAVSAFAFTATEDPVPQQSGAATQKPATQKPAPTKTPAKPASPPVSHFKNGAWLDRGYLSVNGIFQTATPSFTQTQSWTYFAETATVSIEYPGASAPGLDVAGGWRVWRNLAIGAGLAVVSRPSTTVVSGSMPNPLYVNKPTTLSGGFEAKHSETAIHVQASWTMPLRPKMFLMVFGGPSFVNVTQTIVQAEGIGTSIPYPYDNGTITSANTTNQSGMAFGFSAGADFTYFLSKTIGVGGIVRYAMASADFPVTGQPSVPVKAGGLQVGGGLRVVFPPPKPAKPAGPAKPPEKPKTPVKK